MADEGTTTTAPAKKARAARKAAALAPLPPPAQQGAEAFDVAPPGVKPPVLEMWRHSGQGSVFLTKFNAAGVETQVQVKGDKTVTLTPQERRLNQERCASTELDFFKNGTLVPIQLVPEEWDYEQLVNNRQILDDPEIAKLLKASPTAFERRVEELKNPTVLQRIIDIAGDDISVGKLRVLTERLDKLNPDALTQNRLRAASEGGTTGLTETPDPGMPAPQRAEWENFTPTIEFAADR